jgi:hypothetical protein
MNIIGVDTAILGIDDIAAAQRFCSDFGLKETEHGESGSSFETQDGTSIDLRRSNDSSLPPTMLRTSTCRETVWGVGDQMTLEQIGAELSHDRQVRYDSSGIMHTADDDGFAIAFRVTRRHSFDARPARINVAGCAPPARVQSTDRL